MRPGLFYFMMCCILLCSCKTSYNFSKKFSAGELLEDYRYMRKTLETKHPSLYWYTPKDSMDRVFNRYESFIKDSMNEVQFAWRILAPTLQEIHCGHTSLLYSKSYGKHVSKLKLPSFPLHLRAWSDSLAVITSLNKKDSIFKRGTVIRSINGWRSREIINYIFGFLPMDGYSENINYYRLSGNFPVYHRNIMGLSRKYAVEYVDSAGYIKTDSVALLVPVADTTKKRKEVPQPRPPKIKRAERLNNLRSYRKDSSNNYAIIDLNTFHKGALRSFYRKSFRNLKKDKIPNLVIDIRNNGGGRIGLSTLLTKYISDKPFKVADTAFAITRNVGPHSGRFKLGFFNTFQLSFTTRKMADGKFHMRYFEKAVFKPKKKNHYNGNVFVIMSGPTFSAASLFAAAVKGQKNITLVGEETGGGWYGNSGILIPDVTLPNSKLRFRLPLFRLVQAHRPAEKGTGVMPDVHVPPTLKGLKNRVDEKMQRTVELIRK